MKRPVLPLAFIPAAIFAAPAQLPWSDAGGAAWRTESEAKEKDAAIFPMSPNVILGRARYGDPKSGAAVLLLDRLPPGRDALLVARDADCTPRAILKPVSIERGTGTLVCTVTHGDIRPGMEIVLPGAGLLERCRATLPARDRSPATPAATGPSPAKPKS